MESMTLSTKERAALFALLAEAREISNPELEKQVGFRLTGKERLRLNKLKLVDSRKEGQTYVHELTDAGWRWCGDELSGSPGKRAGTMERALYVLLASLKRYLDGTNRTLADLIAPAADGQPLTDAAVEERIMAGYRTLAGEPGAFIRLSGLRRELGQLPQAATDAALDRLYRSQRINLVPQPDQWSLSDDDRAAALHIGGEDKHLISVEPR